MRVSLALPLFLSLGLFVTSIPAKASPGDASSVIAHCGTPQSDTTGISEVDSLPQRTLTYGHTRLNFQQIQGVNRAGWSFTSGWVGPLPMSGHEIATRMPCFGAGLDEAGTRYQKLLQNTDPTIAQRSGAVIGQPQDAFGINHLWLILLLVGIIAIFALAVPRRRRVVHGPDPSVRPFRQPDIALQRFRRRAPRSTLE